MSKLIKSSLYKLLRDWTFRITLIIGAALALFMCLIYAGIDILSGNGTLECLGDMCNGYTFYTSALSPTQNFGLTVPINLIVFTIGEFNCGTIRNKIIAGNKKTSIYLSLVITGLIFTITLMLIYFGLSVGISSLIGGFKGSKPSSFDINFDMALLYQYPLIGLATYIFIVALGIFVATTVRNIGGSLPIVIISIVFLYFLAFIPTIRSLFSEEESIGSLIQSYVNPLYGMGALGLGGITVGASLSTTKFIGTIICPIYWSAILVLLGVVLFNKKDVK